MATIINNPPERVIEVNGTDNGSLLILVVVLVLALIGGGWLYMQYHRVPAAPATSNGGANINVTLPAPSQGQNNEEPANP